MTEDRRQINSKPAKISRQQAMNTAVRILTHRDHSKYELKQKLRQRGFTSKVIDSVVVECERFNYINDPRTAHVYISQLKRKCFGKRYIQMALKKKRLSGTAIENILLENYPEADEREYAARLLEKKMEAFAREADLKKRRDKMSRFLYSRGFRKNIIADLISDLNSQLVR
jgi:regulatory protein